MTEAYINFIVDSSIPKAMILEEIVKATNDDPTLKGLRAAIRLNKWDSPVVKEYRGLPKKRSPHQKRFTWIKMAINMENVDKSYVFVLS